MEHCRRPMGKHMMFQYVAVEEKRNMLDAWRIGRLYLLLGQHEKDVKECYLNGHKMYEQSMKMVPGSARAASAAIGGSQDAKQLVHFCIFEAL